MSKVGRVISIVFDLLMTLFMLVLVGSLTYMTYYLFIYEELPRWF